MGKKIYILGILINLLNDYYESYNCCKSIIGIPNSSYITVNNVHTIIEGVRNRTYKKIINNSFLALPDGKPLSIVAKLKGEKNINRIFGPTFFEKTLEWGQKDGIKHYFFGSSQETINKMLEVIKLKYPKAIIAGSYSPPYKPFTEEENEKFIKDINAAGADLIWVGLGAPKQEIWMYENYKKLK